MPPVEARMRAIFNTIRPQAGSYSGLCARICANMLTKGGIQSIRLECVTNLSRNQLYYSYGY